MKKLTLKINTVVFAALLLFVAVDDAEAIVYDLVSTLPNTVIHKTQQALTWGQTLAYYDVDSSKSSTYNSDTGYLDAYFTVYSDAAKTNVIGSVSIDGTLPENKFNQLTGNVLGTLDWNFDLASNNSLADYLAQSYGPSQTNQYMVTMTYLDVLYFGQIGTGMNSFDNGVMRLWGADGFNGQSFDPQLSFLGGDSEFVFKQQPPVPEPATMALFGMGLLGLGFKKRQLLKK